MDETPTIRRLLDLTRLHFEKRGIESARLDAELLMCHVVKEPRLKLYLDLDRPLLETEVAQYRELVRRRSRLEPIAYILGEREFYGHRFIVRPGVLVPRPETEHLVDEVLARIGVDAEGTIVDACTGSGAIAIAVALARKNLRVLATELSDAAAEIARENVALHNLSDRVEIRVGDLLAPVVDDGPFLAIVANPPYIKRASEPSLMEDVRAHEPMMALIGDDDDGLGHHRRILNHAPPLLAPVAFVALEIGFDQRTDVRALEIPGFSSVEIVNDYAGHSRVALFTNTAGKSE